MIKKFFFSRSYHHESGIYKKKHNSESIKFLWLSIFLFLLSCVSHLMSGGSRNIREKIDNCWMPVKERGMVEIYYFIRLGDLQNFLYSLVYRFPIKKHTPSKTFVCIMTREIYYKYHVIREFSYSFIYVQNSYHIIPMWKWKVNTQDDDDDVSWHKQQQKDFFSE